MATTSKAANMDVSITQTDIGYLIDAAEKTLNQEFYYISYMLLEEAEKILGTLKEQGSAEYTDDLESRIRERLSLIREKGTIKNPPDHYVGRTTIGKLKLFYSEYKEIYQKGTIKDPELEGEYETREYILTTSKALRTALKILSRVARGNTPEEVFIRENEIPEEFLQDTEYDEEGSSETYGLPAEANMDVPISKIDIEYLIDAAENTTFASIPEYVPYMLYKEAQKALENLKKQGPTKTKELESRISEGLLSITEAQKTLEKQDPTEYTKKLEDRILVGLSVITDKDINIPKRPEDYKESESIIQVLAQLYSKYNEDNKIDELYEEDKKHKWGILSAKFQELEGRSAKRERILTTSKVLRNAIKTLYRVAREKEFTQIKIPKEFLHDDEVYNIIPFDGRTLPAEVEEAIKELKLAVADMVPTPGMGGVLDLPGNIFKFQESNVSNQRENIFNLLLNERMRLGEHGTAFNEALENVFLKTLDNYIKWCSYLSIDPIWISVDVISNGNKILYISLYYLIWGEAANVRFLPECLCYIFHHMSNHVDEYLVLNRDLLIEQVPLPPHERPFIDEVIKPLYEVIAAEANINIKRDASHSKWRNYDDFNEYFWSRDCLQLGWPLNRASPFFQRPPPQGSTTVYGKTSFVERRTFIHLYHSFHRIWIFHVLMFEVLVIFALNDGNPNYKTLRETLSVTYVLMKLIQSMFDIVLKYGAYSHTSYVDVLRILIRFIWSMLTTLIICLPRMKCLQEKTSSIEESIGFENYKTVLGIYAVNFTKCLQEKTSLIEESIGFKSYITVLGIYAAFKISFPILCQFLSTRYQNSFVARLIKWINQEEYVGRDMGENYNDIFWYTIFWIVTLATNVAWTYYGLIKYLVPRRDITDHVSKNIHNMLAIGSMWAGVICAYIAGSHVSYNLTSAVVGYSVGRWRDRVGNIKSLGDVRKCFGEIPRRIMDHLNRVPENNHEDVNLIVEGFSPFWNNIVKHLREEDNISDLEKYALSMPTQSERIRVIQWPPFLLVGKVSGAIKIAAKSVSQEVMWHEISSDVYMRYAVQECFHSVEFILSNVFDDQWRAWVVGIYGRIRQSIEARNLHTTFQLNKLASIIKEISELTEALEQESRPHEPIETVPQERRNFEARRRARNRATNALILTNGAKNLYNVIQRDFLIQREAQRIEFADFEWPRDDRPDPELRSPIRRLHMLLNVKSADHVPRNREARRRLEFFTNSLFMSMPRTKPVCEMLSFSVLTPYYDEVVLYTIPDILENKNGGITLIDYLKNLYPDEWNNYCERLKQRNIDNPDDEDLELRLWASYRGQTLARTVRGTMYYQKALLLQAYWETLNVRGSGVDGQSSTSPVPDVSMDVDTRAMLDSLEVRSSRGELLVQTPGIMLRDEANYHPWREEMMGILGSEKVKGFVDGSLKDPDPKGESRDEYVCNYSRKWKKLDKKVKDWIMAYILKDVVKERIKTAKELWETLETYLSTERLDRAKALVDLKFTYVVTCQNYGQQKRERKQVAADIALLLKRNEGLRVAFVDQVNNEFYSKLVKADMNGIETEVYSIKLPGNPILGEGKPENQNHAIVFTRGNAIQTIDMNQDNYFEETLKMRNLLEEFHRDHAPTILGIREHIFTGSASSIASFMSNQETGFVTLGQRVMANPLKVRMHYGHPDVFDRVFHITRGGISKASRGINISEDIYAGFNSTLRQGSVTHHEYIQVGKGRDVGFNQIATFEGKVAGGNGEQVLSRDIYRLGQRFDFFRMLSFYYTTVGYYFSSLLMVITLYILLYGNLIMTFSGTRVPHVLNDTDMAPEWLLMIVLLPAIYMLLVPYLEQGLEKAAESFFAMFFSLGSIFYAFSLGTRIHSFGRTIIHGGASYQATGRGFVLHHINFSENYWRYSRSHFVKGMEVLFLVVVYIIYGFHSVRAFYNNLLLLGGLILSISWIVAPFLFDSSPFNLNKNLEDWEDWNKWLNLKSVEVKSKRTEDKVKESWEFWWNMELDHIRTPVGRFTETILSLRFFIFPLVVGYKLNVQGLTKSLWNCLLPWICVVVILLVYEGKCKRKPVTQIFSTNRVATIVALPLAYYYSASGDMLAFIIAIITTVWGFISFFLNNRLATIGALAIAYYCSALGDTLALFIAIITTVWGFLSICVAWKPTPEIIFQLKYLAWICDIVMLALLPYINIRDDLGTTLLFLLGYVSHACEEFHLWTPVKYLAWICDTGMGALMFKIANMFSQRSIRQYLVRNLFDQNISELLHNSSAETARQHGQGY